MRVSLIRAGLLFLPMAKLKPLANSNCIFLVGFMGAGKTTVGRMLAERLGWKFVDLDDRIVAAEGRDVAEIFRVSGEEHFRAVESGCLREVMAETQDSSIRAHRGRPLLRTRPAGMVVALGGGAFVRPENAAAIRESGARVIFLDAGVDELRRRCAPGGAERPLFRDENQFRQLYEARRGGYMAADLRIDTENKSPEQVVEELTQALAGEEVR